jgi:hypothetical protein
MKVLTIALLATLSCFRDHPPRAVEVTQDDCYTCHQDDYEATTSPAHLSDPSTFTKQCADCHPSTDTWAGATFAHPESRFPIKTGHHQGIECNDCHDQSLGSPNSLDNTNCVSSNCHPRSKYPDKEEHPPWRGDTEPHFCADSGCHPDGRVHDN